MSKSSERLLAFVFGVVFVVVLLVLALAIKNPTPFQYEVFRIVLALAAGGVGSMIPGFLSLEISNWLRAGGAMAVFVIVYFYNPARLSGVTPQDVEINKPIVPITSESRDAQGGFPFIAEAVAAGSDVAQATLEVKSADALMKPGILSKRYGHVTIDGVRATLPAKTVLVANDIDGVRGGAITGNDFSIVARRASNLTIDVSGNAGTSTPAGSVWLYIKKVENSRLLAVGAAGKPGVDGAAGTPGHDGGNGRDGECGPGMFGQFHGSTGGGDGENGGAGGDGARGGDGQPGGSIFLTTIVNPESTTPDVHGGGGGRGGVGAKGGTAGRGGKGGAGCNGLGGSQPNRADGRGGLPGADGHNGVKGEDGRDGEYHVSIVSTFDPIVAKLEKLPNDALHSALQEK